MNKLFPFVLSISLRSCSDSHDKVNLFSTLWEPETVKLWFNWKKEYSIKFQKPHENVWGITTVELSHDTYLEIHRSKMEPEVRSGARKESETPDQSTASATNTPKHNQGSRYKIAL